MIQNDSKACFFTVVAVVFLFVSLYFSFVFFCFVLFFLFVFSFTNIHNLPKQGKERLFFKSSLPLPSAPQTLTH